MAFVKATSATCEAKVSSTDAGDQALRTIRHDDDQLVAIGGCESGLACRNDLSRIGRMLIPTSSW